MLVYALELDSGFALIDAGWDTDEAWNTLREGLSVAGASVADVRAVVVTHVHRDHSGLAGRIRQQSDAWIGLHPADVALLTTRYHSSENFQDSMREVLSVAGAPVDSVPDLCSHTMDVKFRHYESARPID